MTRPTKTTTAKKKKTGRLTEFTENATKLTENTTELKTGLNSLKTGLNSLKTGQTLEWMVPAQSSVLSTAGHKNKIFTKNKDPSRKLNNLRLRG